MKTNILKRKNICIKCGLKTIDHRFKNAKFRSYSPRPDGQKKIRIGKKFEDVIIRQCTFCLLKKMDLKIKLKLNKKSFNAFDGMYIEVGKKEFKNKVKQNGN